MDPRKIEIGFYPNSNSIKGIEIHEKEFAGLADVDIKVTELFNICFWTNIYNTLSLICLYNICNYQYIVSYLKQLTEFIICI